MCTGLEARISRTCEFEEIDAETAQNEEGDHTRPEGHCVSVNNDRRLKDEVQ